MKLFRFTNSRSNFIKGPFHFVAKDIESAWEEAYKYAELHNAKSTNYNYEIQWSDEAKEFDINPGYIDLEGRK